MIILLIIILYSIILKTVILKNNIPYNYYRDIPSEDSPAYVGKVVKGNADGNDIIATILDLSNKGYIKIVTENIKGKERKVISLIKKPSSIELQEHEIFLINQIFKGSYTIVFDDYLRSKKFKNDFIAFNKMLDRRVERKSKYNSSTLRNINKIIFLIIFAILGIALFYSICFPLMSEISKVLFKSEKYTIPINAIISAILHIIISYKYITYINKSTNAQENINLNIAYIILIMIIGIGMIAINLNDIYNIVLLETAWYKVVINFILAVVTLLYMFNIIKHNKENEYIYYFFILISAFSIILNFKIATCIEMIFFTTYNFFKSPKYMNLKEEDYIYKWQSFKKYLEDYSMLKEQQENAILIWEKYLIYAISLGVNKKIIKNYSKLNHINLIDDFYLKRLYNEYLE